MTLSKRRENMLHYTQRFLLVSLFCLLAASAVQAQAFRFTIQVEALDDPDPAFELVEELRASGLDAYYVVSEVPGRGTYYRVRVGNFPNLTAAHHRGEQLRRARVRRFR
jgi:cell division septation protein DedD